jgi:hypothetical protein
MDPRILLALLIAAAAGTGCLKDDVGKAPLPDKSDLVFVYASDIGLSDVIGEWKVGGIPAKIEGKTLKVLRLTTEAGIMGTGAVNADRIEVSAWKVTGRLTADRRNIRWSNGFTWSR